MPDDYLTLKEVAELLKLSERTGRGLTKTASRSQLETNQVTADSTHALGPTWTDKDLVLDLKSLAHLSLGLLSSPTSRLEDF